MNESLGLVETKGMVAAVLVADTMVKCSNVHIIGIENSKGLGYMTIKISGDVGAVNAAVNAGRQLAIENNAFVSSKVIPRPSKGVTVVFCQLKKEENIIVKEDSIALKNDETQVKDVEIKIESEVFLNREDEIKETVIETKDLTSENEKEESLVEDDKVIIEEKKSDIAIDKKEQVSKRNNKSRTQAKKK